jgi:hypothetical protein
MQHLVDQLAKCDDPTIKEVAADNSLLSETGSCPDSSTMTRRFLDEAPRILLNNNTAESDAVDDEATEPSRKGNSQKHALFAGGDPLKAFFFGTFFHGMLTRGFAQDAEHYAAVHKSCTQAVLAGYGYSIVRRLILLLALLAIGSAATGELAYMIPFVGQFLPTGGTVGFIVSLIVAGGILLAFDCFIGLVFTLWIGERREKLANRISGWHTARFIKAKNELAKIYSEQVRHLEGEGAISEDWIRHAREHFLTGHHEAKRLKALEIFTIIQMRRVSAHYIVIDILASLASVSITLIFVFFYLPAAPDLPLPPAGLIAMFVLTAFYFFVGGTKRNDIFSRFILDQMLGSNETYENFNLTGQIADLIEHDQRRIRQLVNTSRRV